MINFKKLLAGTLSAAMVLGTMALPVFADEGSVELNVGERQDYPTFGEAVAAASRGSYSDVTYNIYGKVVVDYGVTSENDIWLAPINKDNTSVQKINFVGKDASAEINISNQRATIGFSEGAVSSDVSYKDLKLSKDNCVYQGCDLDRATEYFSTFLRCANASEHTVTYDSCTFTNGSLNNPYGKTKYTNCTFNNSNNKAYSLWVQPYAAENGGAVTGSVEVEGGKIEAARGIKTYSHSDSVEAEAKLSGTVVKTTEKPAIVASQPGRIELTNVDTKDCTKGLIYAEPKPSNNNLAKIVVDNNELSYVAKVGKAFYVYADDAKIAADDDESKVKSIVANINGTKYFETINEAVAAAKSNDTIKLLSDVTESVEIAADKNITLDLNGKKLTNTDGKHTITNNGTLTIQDSSENKTGTVDNVSHARGALVNTDGAKAVLNGGAFKRSEEAGIDQNNSGGNSWYTIANNGTIEINKGVTVENKGYFSSNMVTGYYNSPTGTGTPTIIINGGTFTGGVKTVKVDECGVLVINDGTFTNEKYSCIMNWNKTTINGGTFTSQNDYSVLNGAWNENATGELRINDGTFTGDISGTIKVSYSDVYTGKITAISGGTFSTDVSAYCADGYQLAKNADGKYIAVPQALTNGIKVAFEQVEGNAGLYNIMLKATDTNAINRLTTADLTFKLDTNDAITYEIKKAGDMDVAPKPDNYNRYLFNFDGVNKADATVTEIVIGQVEFTGYGKFTFGVDSGATTNIVNATKTVDNIVTSYVANGGTTTSEGKLDLGTGITDGEIKQETAKLTVNVSFPNAIKDNDVAYQNMKVTVSGNGVNEEVKLGNGVKFDDTTKTYTVELNDTLVKNNAYTVTVSGAGYRTARYTVSMTGNKELNFWNNVKTAPMVIEKDSTGTGVNTNFLAGDIVKDGQINIYDLSAVVSYFGTDGLSVSNHPEYAKYDLNRDCVIDSKDVAYVLVSWGK